MRIVLASLALSTACSSPPKKQSANFNEGLEVPASCCCKTIPVTAEKELIPVFTLEGRMDCSAKKGDCVDDVQCNGISNSAPESDNGVPPPPAIEPAKQPIGIP